MSDATDDADEVMTEAEQIAFWLNVDPQARSPTVDRAVTMFRRASRSMRRPYKGELFVVIEQDGGGFIGLSTSDDLYALHLAGKIPRHRLTLRMA